MNKFLFSYLTICLLGHSYLAAQNAAISYEVRVNSAGMRSTEGSSLSGSSCQEPGNEEYTALVRVDDVTGGSYACMTCDNNGDCNYSGGTVIRTNTSVAVTAITIGYDMFEDDGGSRCGYDGGDDCRATGTYSIPLVNSYAPTAVNSYNNYTDNQVYNAGSSEHRVRLDNSWRYSGTTNSITPTCTAQNTAYSAGSIRSWSVFLTAGVVYNFNNCSSASNDTYMRLYAADGYTAVATGDDNCGSLSAINFTPGSTGWYYLELAQYSRAALSLGGTLTYSIAAPTVSTNGGNQTVCPSVSTASLGGNAPSVGTGSWSASSGAISFSGVSNPSSTASGTPAGSYTLTWTINNGGCLSTSNLNLTINSLSTAPTGISGVTTICNGGNTTLTISGGSAGTGASAKWYTGGCGTTLVGTGNSIVVSPTSTTTYYVRYEGTCNNTTCASTTVTVNQLSTAPTGISGTTTICNGGNTVLTATGGSAGTGANLAWYSGSCGGTFVGTGASVTVSPASTTTYFVRYEGTCNNTGCASTTVNVNTLSVAPTTVSGTTTICNGGNTVLTVSGGTLGTGAAAQWYSSSCGTTLVGTGASITVSPASTTTYFVRYEGTCNNTACISQTVTVNTLSTAPTSISGTTTICNGGSTTLTISGGSLGTGANTVWYSGACGGTPVALGNSVSFSPSTTTTYYARNEGTCNTTTCASVTITVNTVSTPPSIASLAPEYCPNTDIVLTAGGGTAGTGSYIAWYTGPNGTGSLVGSGSPITVTPMSTTTYYARREGGCTTTTDDSETANIKAFVYAANNTSANSYCTDNAGWNHFYNGSQIILSLQGDMSGVTGMNATIYDNNAHYVNGGNPALCNTNWTPGEQRFEMERSWNITYTGTLNGSYNVRYYYQPAERTNVETAAANWMATYPACGYTYKYNPGANGWYWFKNTSSAYTAPQYDGLHLASSSTSSVNGINYSVLTGVTSFSGGSGAVILVPRVDLPIELVSFSGVYRNQTNILNWKTATETNNAYFEIERSADGASNFTKIGEQQGHGTTTTPHDYQFVDEHILLGTNYYRLRQVDLDGTESYSNVIAVATPTTIDDYKLYPNPTTDAVTYEFYMANDGELAIEVTNLLGQILQHKEYTVSAGLQRLPIDLSQYPNGTYLIQVYHKNLPEARSQKVIKNTP